MFYLRLFGGAVGFILGSLYGITIALVRRDTTRVAYDAAHMIGRLTFPPLGLSVEVVNRERLEADAPCVYVANHQNALDVALFAELYPMNTVIVAKKELVRVPIFGWLFVRTRNVLIDRQSNPAAIQRLREAEVAIRERGVSILIFPEGTRGGGTGTLLPFKRGAFYMAVSAKVPIVPIVVAPMKESFDLGERRIRPGKIRVNVLEPISTQGMTDRDVPLLLEEVRARMLTELTVPATTPPAL